jgi:hypothetical protein
MSRGALAALALALCAAAQQPLVRTILANGSTQSRYDLVILGDGYQAQEQARFDQDVTTFLAALYQKEPYTTFGAYVNVHSVFRASQDSGASHPDANPPIVRNTAYGARYNTGGTARCLYITNTSRALADAAMAPANEGRVLVLVNDSRYGGCAAQFSVSYNGSSMTEVQLHEMGHSLAGLADEYDYPNQTYSGPEPAQVNITTSSIGQKWSHWWGFDGISSFQGAGYYVQGLWRPRSNCLMRALGTGNCSVCKEQVSRSLNAVADVIESPQPASTSVTVNWPNAQQFSFTTFVPAGNNPLITWSVDGQPVAGQNGSAFALDSSALALGPHTVQATVLDRTPLVRSDPSGTMRDTHTWNVSVVDPNAAELSLIALAPATVWVTPGAEVDITTTVRNDGPNGAAGVVVEHFLSLDNVLHTSDWYLGGVTVPSLPAQTELQIQRRVRLPALMPSQTCYVIGVVDRANTSAGPSCSARAPAAIPCSSTATTCSTRATTRRSRSPPAARCCRRSSRAAPRRGPST